MDIDTLNQLLWKHDLMGTGCNQSPDLLDEYWTRADGICARLAQGEPLERAIPAEFEEAFWEDCLASPERQRRLQALLADLRTQNRA